MKREVMRVTDLNAKRKVGCCLNHIYLNLYEGEVLGIVGLHDAGKTFLFDCIMGEAAVDSGMLFFMEQRIDWDYAQRNLSIYRIRKQSSLVESRSVLENLFIIRKRKKQSIWISWKTINSRAEICLKEFDINIDLRRNIQELSLEQRHEVEILKAYIMGYRLVLIDDVLSAYRPGDYRKLYELIEKMQKKGMSFIMAGCQLEIMRIFTERCLFMVEGWAVKTVENIRRKQIDEVQLMFGGKLNVSERSEKFLPELKKHRQITENQEKELLASIEYCSREGKNKRRLEIYKGEVLVFLDINHEEEINIRALFNKKRIKSGKIEIEKTTCNTHTQICVTDFLNTQPMIGSLNLCDNLCLALYSRISRLGFISKRKAAVVEKLFLEQYQDWGWKEINSTYLPFAKEMAVFLERLKLQKWKLMFCFNLENIMSYELEGMIKEQLLKMAEAKRSICIFASSLEKFKDFPDYYLILEGDGVIGKYTYQELREYFGI